MVLGGVGLAVFSWFFASTWPLDNEITGEDVFGSFRNLDVSGVPGKYAATTLLAGVLVLAALGVAAVRVVRGRDGYGTWGPFVLLAVGAGLLVWPVMAWRDHLPGLWRQVRIQYPPFEQLPTAVVAGTLVVVGTALVAAVAARPETLRALRLPVLVLTVVVGLAVSGVAAALAIRAGDDERRVDRSTAAAQPPAAVPDRMGAAAYRMSVPAAKTGTGEPRTDLVVAGAGFAIAEPDGITAYDGATGTERWHYRRTNTLDPRGNRYTAYLPGTLRSLDGGTVVLSDWGELGWTAFDATTGEILWRNSDFAGDMDDPGIRRDLGDFRLTSGFLVVSESNRVVRYDARTGARMWSLDTTKLQCTGYFSPITITETAIYRLAGCGPDNETVAHLSAIDPRTGAVIAEQELPLSSENGPRTSAYLQRHGNAVLVQWKLAGSSAWSVVTTPQQLGAPLPWTLHTAQTPPPVEFERHRSPDTELTGALPVPGAFLTITPGAHSLDVIGYRPE
ncbi:outer membrane protein assembly factor BamB family protein [Nocardia blacklockiae]|uniref:outer membrane protein assembly factor BamB family protein n=1 Tax=Nocardia blacklockiae TaxID=480036 RepID=UPI0018960358|nr:PQQ-binding-like beta-propeller repeat protein [Nocardia blacklockiae]MBF6171983.1 PQQ-binding-like beta-propeller repeat protein [Nocardia blacklockiae]